MNTHELTEQLLAAADEVRVSLVELEKQAREYAKAEAAYRQQKATAFLATQGTVAERESRAETAINEARLRRDMAEGLRLSALEAVRSRRAVLSALQSLMASNRAEAQLARFGPEEPQWSTPAGERGTA